MSKSTKELERADNRPGADVVRRAFERLRIGIYDKEKYRTTGLAILAKHGGPGTANIRDLNPKFFAAVTFEARVALAMHLATIGPVLPLRRGCKTPVTARGVLDAATDEPTIREWTRRNPDCNWGISRNVIDVDTKPPAAGHRLTGLETWDALLMEHADDFEPETLQAETPSGGKHYYVVEDLPNGAHTLGDGVDSRATGKGYVVAPGSHVVENPAEKVTATGFYKWVNASPINSVPWVSKVIGTVRPAVERTDIEAEPVLDPERAAELLNVLDPVTYRDQDKWFRLMCSYHYVTAGEGFDDFDVWCKRDTEYPGNPEFEYRWESLGVHKKGDIDERELYDAVTAAGRDDLIAAAIAASEFAEPLDASAFDADMNLKSTWKISATPFSPVDPRNIAPRDWLYGLHYIRKYLVADISPGGGGKTSNALVEAISMATGVDLLGVGRMYPRPVKVWCWNGEDPKEELDRRVSAICKFYSEPDQDQFLEEDKPPLLDAAALARLKENLFLDTGRTTPIKIAKETKGGTVIAIPLVEGLIEEVRAKQIDVLIVDPFVSSHSVSENDNAKIDQVIKEGWVAVAERGNCCINLVHHARKIAKGTEYGAADARGASALVDAARDVRVFNMMTSAEAEKSHISQSERWRYFRVDADKPNMAVRGAMSPWRCLESVSLGNARDGFPADNVGVVARWKPQEPDALATEITKDKILKAALVLFKQGKRVTKTHGNNSIRKMVPTFRTLTGIDRINASDIAASYEAATNSTPATWVYQDSDKKKRGGAGYFPVMG